MEIELSLIVSGDIVLLEEGIKLLEYLAIRVGRCYLMTKVIHMFTYSNPC